MKITLKNFGPIYEAKDISVAPLTLFVGPGSTGKSYLAMALRAAFEAADGAFDFFSKDIPDVATTKTSDMSPVIFETWAKDLQQKWRQNIAYYLDETGEFISRQTLATVSSDDNEIFVDLHECHKSRIGHKLKDSLAKDFVLNVWENFLKKTYYLPAVRGGSIQSYRTMANMVIQHANEYTKESRSQYVQNQDIRKMFSGVLGNLVQQLTDIRSETGDQKILEANSVLESKILKGRIDVSQDGKYPDFHYAMNEKITEPPIAINNVSAAVAELAPISLFIRYYLRGGNLLILEEPETNLHPMAQRDMVDILVRLANAGVFVLATTHSDIVLEQIGNVYRASEFKDAQKAKVLLGEDREMLDRDKEIAVYSFVKQQSSGTIPPIGGGTIVEKVNPAHMTGVMTEDHLDAARSLYNQTVRMVNGKNNE